MTGRPSWYQRLALSREPDFKIGDPDAPSLLRWWVIPRNRWFNIYLHKWLKSDEDRALHDHMYINFSYLLKGSYREVTPAAGYLDVQAFKRKTYQQGAIKFRLPSSPHRIELINGICWSLFVTGPRVREWGFWCERGWKPWQEFVKPGKHGEVGRGCED